MNKYLLRGLVQIFIAFLIISVGYYFMQEQIKWYKPIMIIGVLIFASGFLHIIYRFLRKIDRSSLLEKRKEKKEEK